MSQDLDDGPFFHGTVADLHAGELLTSGRPSNYRPDVIMRHVYFTALVDGAGLAAAQEANDPALAAEVLQAAYRTDVRPLVAEARRRNQAARNPLGTFRASGYRAATIAERGTGTVATGL